MKPSASGGAPAVAMTRGAKSCAMRVKRRKSAGTNETRWPALRSPRSTGPKKPDNNSTPGRVNIRNMSVSSAPKTCSSSKSSRSPSACKNALGWPGPNGMTSRSRVPIRAAAASAEIDDIGYLEAIASTRGAYRRARFAVGRYLMGSCATRSRRTSKCRWAPRALPVLPTVATTSPFSTNSPFDTLFLVLCA